VTEGDDTHTPVAADGALQSDAIPIDKNISTTK
jgi:hypothetical protein